MAANIAWKRFCTENDGNTDTYYIGSNYLSICGAATGINSTEASLVPPGLTRVLETGEMFRCEYPCDSPTEKRWFELTASALDADGARFIIVQHRNISTRKLEQLDAEDAFLQSEILSALVATSNDSILSYDLDGRITTWNRAAQKLYGYTADEAIGQSLEMLYPPNWPIRVSQYRDQIVAGTLKSFEATRIAKSGEERTVWITCAPLRSAHGDVVMISNIHRDVTEVRKAEAARDIIAHEVVHRAKNMLTVVGAIHRQTARTAATLGEFNQKFGDRIQALSTSTDLLVSGNWTTVGLEALVRSQTEPFFNDSTALISVNGPPIMLQPQAVQVIGMALHELSTNSAKHGALRTKGGRIDITWDLRSVDSDPILAFDWTETGISAVTGTLTKGFGNTVLTMLSNSMLDAQADYMIDGTSVKWNLSMPDKHFRTDKPS